MNAKVNSRFQVGHTVIANFKSAGKLYPCAIIAVSFTDYGKVLYDLEVQPYLDEDSSKIRYYLKGVDSCAIEDPTDDIIDNILNQPK